MAESSVSSVGSRPPSSSQKSFDQMVVILDAKDVYSYTIPSFCAITMNLQHVLLQYDTEMLDASFVFKRPESRNLCLLMCVFALLV